MRDRMPPNATEFEEVVLGAMMLENECIHEILTILEARSFYVPANEKVFTAIVRLFSTSQPVNILTVTQELMRMNALKDVGGAAYVPSLTNRVASSANVEYHARIIAQKFIQRELIAVSTQTIQNAYADDSDVFDLLGSAEKGITQLTNKINTNKIDGIASIYNKWTEHNEVIVKNEGGISGVQSGFTKLDGITGGWQKSDLVIIAARPAMGKTSFVLSMARNAAVDFKHPIAIFSIEMSKRQILTRLMSQETLTSAHRYTRYGLKPDELVENMERCKGLINANIFMDDTPSLKIAELKSKARKLKRDHDISAIYIDYLQIMSTGEKSRGKTEDVGLISNSLKALAKELDIPVIALSQMSRKVDERGGSRRPELSDLRNSGEIEQDADVVIFIHRDEYYGITEDEHGNSTIGKAAIIIEKNRSGALDDIILNWHGETTSFSNLGSLNRDVRDYTQPLKANDSWENESPVV